MMVGCDLRTGINSRLQPLGALDPNTILVDERTLIDRLSFCARYAELIVFFDQNNQPNGNWRQFFLKDPLILMAAISTTEYTSKHRLFLLLQEKLKRSKNSDWLYETLKKAPPSHKDLQLLAQMFALINGLFSEINDWLEQMDIGHKPYALRTFVQQQVQNTLAIQFGQLIELQKLCHFIFKEIPAPDFVALADFNPLWQSTMHTRSLTLLDTDNHRQLVIDINVLERLEQIYHQVFGFYVQVVDTAKDSFNELWDNLSQSRDSYADTALLIAFAQLMQVQQDQLNQLTQTHLNFYYNDILHQNLCPAKGDNAIVCLTLKPNAEPLLLPQGTLFEGGVDAQQQPQQFVTQQSQWFNQIQIEQVQTLRYEQQRDSLKKFTKGQLFTNVIKDANTVVKNPQGQLRSWPLLGDKNVKPSSQGWAVASPLLSLSGGIRTITLTMAWADEWVVSIDAILKSHFFLSGEKDWLAIQKIDATSLDKDGNAISTNIKSEIDEVISTNTKKDLPVFKLKLAINLVVTEPAIAPFVKNPDGYSSEWPLFKWLLSEQLDLTKPPKMISLKIDVAVDEFHGVALYNDDGKLSADSAFMPFGPIPNKGSQFYLGSAEIFAKPLTDLKVKVIWQQLPKNMTDYYQTYNQYCANAFATLNQKQSTYTENPFNNAAFKGIFSLFNDLKWNPATVSNVLPSTSYSASQSKLSTYSVFSFDKKELKEHKYSTELLLSPLDFKQPLKPGFIRLQLTSPDDGFGQPLYAKVVTVVTQENAYRLIKVIKKQRELTSLFGKKIAPVDADNQVTSSEAGKAVNLFIDVKKDDTKDKKINKKDAKKASKLLSLEIEKFLHIDKLAGIEKSIENDLHIEKLEKIEKPIEDDLHSNKLVTIEKQIEEDLNSNPKKAEKGVQLIADMTKTVVDSVDPSTAPVIDKVIDDVADKVDGELKNQKTDKDNKNKNKPTLISMPNLPYVPKIASLSLSYEASKTFDLSKTSDYPCELFHCDSFSAYSVYGSDVTDADPQSPGMVKQTKGVALVPGVAPGGCLYIGLNHIQPPCNLSLYFQLNDLVAFSTQIKPKINCAKKTPKTTQQSQRDVRGALTFYYLSDTSWRPLEILSDGTSGLKCSGIIEVMLPADMSKDPDLLPFSKPADKTTGERGWIAIQGSGKISDYPNVVYLNSQAVQLTRKFQQPWQQVDAPTLAAKSITALSVANPIVEGILQPFSAFGGHGKESQNRFYRRVSERINNKDRVVALDDFATLACEALPDLYYCKTVKAQGRQQPIQLILVGLKWSTLTMKWCK